MNLRHRSKSKVTILFAAVGSLRSKLKKGTTAGRTISTFVFRRRMGATALLSPPAPHYTFCSAANSAALRALGSEFRCRNDGFADNAPTRCGFENGSFLHTASVAKCRGNRKPSFAVEGTKDGADSYSPNSRKVKCLVWQATLRPWAVALGG